jgi:DNA topoisomerase IB
MDRRVDLRQSARHLQATGKDARGRKQYRYHPAWVAERDCNKYGSLADFAQVLPRIRRAVVRDLRRPALCKERVLAAVVRLMDRAFVRVGGERYRRDNGSFGPRRFATGMCAGQVHASCSTFAASPASATRSRSTTAASCA